jgi:hypothetical protein
MDVIGLLLIAASLSLFLLPLGLIRQTQRGLHNPSMVSPRPSSFVLDGLAEAGIIECIISRIASIIEWRVVAWCMCTE